MLPLRRLLKDRGKSERLALSLEDFESVWMKNPGKKLDHRKGITN